MPEPLPATEAGRYEEWVGKVADALHETCRLEWQAIAVADPTRQVTQHLSDAHYGQAHDLVRRLSLDALVRVEAVASQEARIRGALTWIAKRQAQPFFPGLSDDYRQGWTDAYEEVASQLAALAPAPAPSEEATR